MELQNILYTISYTNLEKALSDDENLIDKYLTICGNGNASILPTIKSYLHSDFKLSRINSDKIKRPL
jgi:hypothetical protein